MIKVIGVPKHSDFEPDYFLAKGNGKPSKLLHSFRNEGWEQRGNNSYYYQKEREGSRVKSVYVGRGEMAHMISQFESSSAELEKLMRAKKSIEADELEKVEATLDRAIELTQLFTQAALLVTGFHTHHRQWRRKRN